MTHPYRNLDSAQYWKSAMAYQAPALIDPAQKSSLQISPKDKIISLGSCFAQHLSHHLQAAGLHYWIPEQAPAGMSAADAKQRQYEIYSARYGNIYTPAQATQLLLRAMGRFTPSENAWALDDSFVDPFRPQVEPNGFESIEALLDDQQRHLSFVLEAFSKAQQIIFTLGLTQTWKNVLDGAIYPIAPGVAGGQFDAALYGFINFDVPTLIQDLGQFRQLICEINPKAHIILTVSPVPLAATYTPEHVWTATTYSKAALRVAAQTASEQFDNVHYFPAYEIITSPLNEGRYWQNDFRQVTQSGVRHVMRSFIDCFTQKDSLNPPKDNHLLDDMQVVCEEDLLSSSLKSSPEKVDASSHTLTEDGESSAALFNERDYLEANPDVAKALAEGLILSAKEHYEKFGRYEGRRLRK
jgi:hypothetical protein